MRAPTAPYPCRLCGAPLEAFQTFPKGAVYERCPECQLIQRHEGQLPGAREEKARYKTHQNSHDNAGYVDYQTRFAEATVYRRVRPPASILDFGCGPGPVLVDLMNERGFAVAKYDPFFARDETALSRQYAAVCAVEVVEHFHRPAESFSLLRSLVEPGGWVFLRTELFAGTAEDFSRWWYTNDFTHVAFYSAKTVERVAEMTGCRLVDVQHNSMIALRATY